MTRQSLLFLSSLLLLFILFIQFHDPAQAATGEVAAATGDDNAAIEDLSSGNAVIISIQTRDKIVIIRSGPDGPLYTVKSKDGKVLSDDINAESLYAEYPELEGVVKRGIAGNDAALRLNQQYNISDSELSAP
jgi:hypothetical protein